MNTCTRKFIIQPIPAREGDRFYQCCECCDTLLETGNFVVVIQVKHPNYTANLFLGCQIDCPICGERNTLLEVFNDEDEMVAEMQLLKQDIEETGSLIKHVIIPDISPSDIEEIFETDDNN